MAELKRLRLGLPLHDADLVLVGEEFQEGAAIVQMEIPRSESAVWTWLDWDDLYTRLEESWRARYYRERREQ